MSMLKGSHLHGKRTPGSVLQDGQPIHPLAGVLRRSHEWKGFKTDCSWVQEAPPSIPLEKGGGEEVAPCQGSSSG